MKNLTLILALLLTLLLTACGGSGGGAAGGSGGSGHIPDTTPHDYSITASALTNTALPHPVDLHQLCDFGYMDVRDESVSLVLQDPAVTGGIGCAAASNVVFEVDNTGTDSVYVAVYVDGVLQPVVQVLPGTTYTFTRGY